MRTGAWPSEWTARPSTRSSTPCRRRGSTTSASGDRPTSATGTGATWPLGSRRDRRGWPRRIAGATRCNAMRSRDAFSYIVLRVVPDIEREEFVNAGVVVFCPPRRFLEARVEVDPEALRALDPDCDVPAIDAQLDMVRAVASGTLER